MVINYKDILKKNGDKIFKGIATATVEEKKMFNKLGDWYAQEIIYIDEDEEIDE